MAIVSLTRTILQCFGQFRIELEGSVPTFRPRGRHALPAAREAVMPALAVA
jgi:hypothetical protein